MYLPKRDELSLRTVLAFPNAEQSIVHRCRSPLPRCAPTFENRIGVENLLLNPRMLSARSRQELQRQLGRLGLAAATLTTDNNTLIMLVALHAPESIVTDGEDVRWQFADFLVRVLPDVINVVDVQQLVRIDRD